VGGVLSTVKIIIRDTPTQSARGEGTREEKKSLQRGLEKTVMERKKNHVMMGDKKENSLERRWGREEDDKIKKADWRSGELLSLEELGSGEFGIRQLARWEVRSRREKRR